MGEVDAALAGLLGEQLLGPALDEDGEELVDAGLLLQLRPRPVDRVADVLRGQGAVLLAHEGTVEHVDLLRVCVRHGASQALLPGPGHDVRVTGGRTLAVERVTRLSAARGSAPSA
ncbi:hypothetical protein [Serinicoccus chungangensis]|uniref:hypothetical protein n=1 Tax=Serinicoccus chungangensis TaxID=767452 RepID=UPI00128EA781|nr:hypothetical protein [Serinicoccus chungangensis]